MSHLSLPPLDRKILKKTFTYINQFPTKTHTLSTLAGTSPSLKLGEELIRNYKKRTSSTKKPTNHSHSVDKSTTQPPTTKQQPETHAPSLIDLHKSIASCTACKLHIHRKKTPFKLHTGSSIPIMVLLDIVNWSDQLQSKLFTTPDGELLLKILKALELHPEEIYFTTAIKCSSVEEISNQLETFSICLNHFHAELELLKPKLILAFGEDSYKILNRQDNFTEILGNLQHYKDYEIVYTHHPKELVNDPTLKKETWEHLKKHLKKIETLKQPSVP